MTSNFDTAEIIYKMELRQNETLANEWKELRPSNVRVRKCDTGLAELIRQMVRSLPTLLRSSTLSTSTLDMRALSLHITVYFILCFSESRRIQF